MGRPDIPKDIWEAAQRAQDDAEAECYKERYVYGFGTGNAKETIDRHIALAILAERERAAKIAEALDPEKPANWLHRRENIAAAIRRGSP